MSSSTLDRAAVINTRPIIALVAGVNSLEVLASLYDHLVVPRAVWTELLAGGDDSPEIKALKKLSKGIEVPPVDLQVTDTRVMLLDSGEAAVLQTALDGGISRVIIDEDVSVRSLLVG